MGQAERREMETQETNEDGKRRGEERQAKGNNETNTNGGKVRREEKN